MAIAFSHSGSATATSGSIAVTVTINPRDTVVVLILADSATQRTVTSVTDTGGSVYTQQAISTFNTPLLAYLWSTKASQAAASTSVTVTLSGTYTEAEVVVLTYTGAVGIGRSTIANGTATTTPSIVGNIANIPSNWLVGGIGSLSTTALVASVGNLRAQQVGAASIIGGVDNTAGVATDTLTVTSASAIFVAVALELIANVPSRNNQNVAQGVIVQNTLAGTGSAQNIIAAQGAGIYTDVLSIVLTSSAATAQTTISDGTISYVYNVSNVSPVSVEFPVPLKATNANTAWTFNAATATSAVMQAITATS